MTGMGRTVNTVLLGRQWRAARAAAALALLATSSGCLTLFSQEIRESISSDKDLRALRYTLCKEVTLARDVTDSQARVAGTHALTIRNGRSIDYVIFPAGTSGTVVASGGNWLELKFERGPGRLRFMAPDDDATPNDVSTYKSGISVVVGEPVDVYRLAAYGWDYGPMLMPWGLTETGWHGTVDYGGEDYIAIESSFATCLQIDASSIHTETKTKRVVTGLDVSEVQAEEDERVRAGERARKRRPANNESQAAEPRPQRRRAPPPEED